jgi:hypothetical protein
MDATNGFPHWMGLSTLRNGSLIEVGGPSSTYKNSGNRSRIHRYLRNQRSYCKKDSAIRFISLRRSNHPLKRCSNRSFTHFAGKWKSRWKSQKSETYPSIPR